MSNSTHQPGAKLTPKNDSKSGQPSLGFQAIGSLFSQYQPAQDKGYITQEFQDYGYRLALELDDLGHKSLYIRLAKTNPRAWLEQARSFVSDANALSKPKLFMWKLKQIRLASKTLPNSAEKKTPKPKPNAKN